MLGTTSFKGHNLELSLNEVITAWRIYQKTYLLF